MILTLTSFKGGVSKTTTAVHLAHYFAKRGKTLLIDGDPNRSATVWSERGTLSFPVVTEDKAQENIEESSFVIVDTPARPQTDELKTLAKDSDLLLIPTTPDVLSISALLLITDVLKDFGASNYKILLTQVPPRSFAGREARSLLAEHNLPVLKAEIRRRAVFTHSALGGTTVDKLKTGKDAWKDITELGKEILKYV